MQVDIDVMLDRWQSELLDLSRRNRMINYRLTSRSTLNILEPGLDEMYARLGSGSMSFQRPLDRMTDARLYSLLALMETLGTPLPVVLGDIKAEGSMLERQRTLNNLRQKARLALEEQGANILFMSLGFLKWRDGEGAQGVDRLAPLVLMPVNITQASVGAPLMLERRDEDVTANPTLEYFLKITYGIELPAFDGDAPTLEGYLQGVQRSVEHMGWRVVRACSLGLISFLKLSMYEDMERNRAAMRAHPVIRALAGERGALAPGRDVERGFHDAQDPADSFQVVSADSSQQDAIELSRRGESFIMQGPPGTGKSQTITNIIAQALADGRRVLFVAEKMAALQVVYRKLQDAGLSDFCLPIHSHKANKREVLAELGRTLELGHPQVRDEARAQLDQLRAARGLLGEYARQLHEPLEPLGMSAYEALGELACLRGAAGGARSADARLDAALDALGRLSAEVDGAGELDAGELALRCERARAYGAARARCPLSDPFEGMSASLAQRGRLLRAIEEARAGVEELAALMPELRARGLRGAGMDELDALRDALQAASSARSLPARWARERDGARLRALCAGLREDARSLERGRADMAAVCEERALDADFDAICALMDALERVGGAPAARGELSEGAARLCAQADELRAQLAGLAARSRAYCALTGMPGDASLEGMDARAQALELMHVCAGLPEGCVLAGAEERAGLLAPLARRLGRRAELRALLGGGADWDAARRLEELERAGDIARGAQSAGIEPTPEGLERWGAEVLDARARYGALCSAAEEAARAAKVEGESMDAALRACALLDALGPVPPGWADARARAQLARDLGGMCARAHVLDDERAALELRFTSRAFEPETERALKQFNALRGSVLRVLRPAYHAARQRLRECLRGGELSDGDMARALGEAVDYAARAGELSAEVWARAPMLGARLQPDGRVDWEALTRDLAAFDELCGLLGDRGAAAAAAQPERGAAARLREAILALEKGASELGRLGVEVDPARGAQPGLDECARAAGRARELAGAIAQICRARGAAASYSAALELARAAVEVGRLDAELMQPDARWLALLGEDMPRDPDGWAELARRLGALGELERAQGGRLTMRTRELLISPARDAMMDGALREALEREGAREGGSARAGQLRADAARLAGGEEMRDAGEMRAALDGLEARARRGEAAFGQACAALRPGVPRRRIAAYARDLKRLRALRQKLGAQGEAAAELGEIWRGEATNWAYLDDCVTLLEQVRAAQARLDAGLGALIDDAFGRGPEDALCDRALMALAGARRARAALAGVGDALGALEPDALYARLEACARAPELLGAHIALDAARRDLAKAGMDGFARALDAAFERAYGLDGRVQDGGAEAALARAARDAYRRAFIEAWLDWAQARLSALDGFRADVQYARVEEFARLDDVQLVIARARLRQRLCASLPGEGHMRAGDEYAVLMHELAKRQRHMSLRRLFSAIPNLLMRLKPCLMMSPLSVAYFLEAETYKFDLVIFDEASQVQPQDALGAIARGAQVIIAGDPLQLPPTRFFAAALDDGADDEEDGPVYESILEGAGMALRRCMLKWHYRSRHEHLIAFSNARIYGGGLITFPSARERERDMGVEYVYVENGVYEGQGINQSEARRCVQLVGRHILAHPERSLGIIAFSQKQQAAIEYAMDQFRLAHPEFEWFFGEADEAGARRDEPFFIKNLENVQGDERDTIIFSVGYGRNRQGRMYMRFGPLSSAGGERRLNVAITRAKLNVKLVCSILPDDIELRASSSAGARMLRDYMAFALRGASALGPGASADAPRDMFCDYIARALEADGYSVARRVGCSAYRVDIALERPGEPGAYFAGIECDGPTYAGARTARERDHLRARVLEGMGWRLLRVWSSELRADPEGQLRRVLEFARAASASSAPEAPEPELEPEQDWLTSEPPAPEAPELPWGMARYQAADWRDAPGGRGAGLEACLKYVISIEQPIHIELLQRRLAGFFGNEKVTASARRAIDEALMRLDGREVERAQGFVYLKPRPPIRARTPAPDAAPRRIEHIAPEEIESCMCGIIAGTFGITREALLSETVRALGYDRAGARITAALDAAYARILSSGRACLLEGKLKLTGGQ